MKTSTMIAVAGMLAAAGAANAQLGGLTWTFNNNGTGGSFVDTGVTLTIVGGDNGVGGDSDYATNLPIAGTIAFSWAYFSNDSGTFDSGYYRNPSKTTLAFNNSTIKAGNVSTPVVAGAFAFGVNTVDGIFGPGTLEITNFSYTPIPAPGAFALLGLGGLVAARRRR